MVRLVIAGAALFFAFASSIAGAWQVITMQGGGTPPAANPQAAPKGTGLIVGQVVDADSGRPIPGAIINFVSNLPTLPDAMVFFNNANIRRVITNADGRFMFHSVPAGYIAISAFASSYIDAGIGQRRPSGPSQPLLLADGERVPSLTIRMWKYAAIEGRVVDENNEPAVETQVRVWRREWSGGRLRLTAGLNTSTDDRGVFRIPQLTPGDYYVSVPLSQLTLPISVAQAHQDLLEKGGGTASSDLARQLSASGAPSVSQGGIRFGAHLLQSVRALAASVRPEAGGERLFVYPPAFSPSLDADPIRLGSGDLHQGVEIALRLVPTVTVSGVLTGPDGPVAHVGVQLTPTRLYGNSSFPGTEAARTATDANGAFTFLGIAADQYKLSVTSVPRPALTTTSTIVTSGGSAVSTVSSAVGGAAAVPSEPSLFAELDLAVGKEDVTGLNVQVHHGARITGSVVFNGAATAPTPEQISRMSINLRPASGAAVGLLTPGRVDTDMRIRTIGYPPGRYFVATSSPAPGWFLSSVVVGSRDTDRSGIELGDSDISNLVLTFTDKRTEVTGTVRARTANGDPDAVVIAIPSDVRGWTADGMNPRLMATARTSVAGTYTLGGLPPGDYRVIAMSEDFAVETRDPAFLGRLVQLGTTISLREGDKRTLDLRTENPPRRSPTVPEGAPDSVGDATMGPSPSDIATSGPFVPDGPAAPQQRTPPRDIPSGAPAGTGVITGIVVTDDAEKKPIRKVQVTLDGTALRPSLVTTTGDDGRFLFEGVPAGRFTIRATRLPYAATWYGATRPGRAGTTLALAEGQRIAGLTIPMIRGAVIEGTVINEFGLPEERAQVMLLQQRPGTEGPQLATSGGSLYSVTDDRGHYRAFGLAPGEYIVGVINFATSGASLTRITDADMRWATAALDPARRNNTPPPSASAVANVPVYHPGVTDVAQARVIKISVAEERVGVDINLTAVPAATVKGRIVTADGQPPMQLQLSMLLEGPSIPLISSRLFPRPAADGSFQVDGAAPGRYVIAARAASRPIGAPTTLPPGGRGAAPSLDLWAMQTVDVNGEDVTGVLLTLAPGLTVRGRVVFDKTTATPPERFAGVSVRLSPASSTGASIGVPPATVSEDGTFALTGVTPNAYRVGITAPGRGQTWMMRSAVVGGRDVSDGPMVVTPDADVVDVVVTMTDRVTEISGLLLDAAGRPAPELTMLAFPVDKAQWGRDSRRRPPPTRPGTDGRYRLIAVPPGEYYMVAVSDFIMEELYDFSLLESLIPSAIKISLAEGEKTVQDFKLSGR